MEVEQRFGTISLNFNLRNPRSTKPTIIYAIVRIGQKQYKISTGVKIFASKWNFRFQTVSLCTVNNTDYKNLCEVLNIINIYKQSMIGLKAYICNNKICVNNHEDILHIFTNIINHKRGYTMNTGNRKRINTNNSIISWLYRYVNENKQGNTLIKERQNIGLLKHFFDENPQWKDDFANIGFDLVNAAFRYIENATMPNGKQYAISTIREAQKKIKAALKVASNRENRKFDWRKSEIDEVQLTKNNIPKSERGMKKAPLTSEEVAKLRNYKCEGAQEIARDLFLIQCYSGQRRSDLVKLLNSSNIDWNAHLITVKQMKGKSPAYVPMKDTVLINLIRKYEGKVKRLPIKYNETLRRVAKNIGLTRIVEYTEQRGLKTEEKKGPIYELIHNHIARHTFITRMAEEGATKDEVKAITGHTCDATVENIYTHIDRVKAAQKGAEYQKIMYVEETAEMASAPHIGDTDLMSDRTMDMIVNLRLQCHQLNSELTSLQEENAELASICRRHEYDEKVEELQWLLPTEDIIYTV